MESPEIDNGTQEVSDSEYYSEEDKKYLKSLEIESEGTRPLIKMTDDILEEVGEIIYELKSLKEQNDEDKLSDEQIDISKAQLIPRIIEWYTDAYAGNIPFPVEMLAGFAYQMFWSYLGTEDDFKKDYHAYIDGMKKIKNIYLI